MAGYRIYGAGPGEIQATSQEVTREGGVTKVTFTVAEATAQLEPGIRYTVRLAAPVECPAGTAISFASRTADGAVSGFSQETMLDRDCQVEAVHGWMLFR